MGSRLEQNSSAVRKRIASHTFDDEDGEEYSASAFGGLSDYFRRKKIKLQNLDVELRASAGDKPQIFKDVVAHVSGYTQPPLNVLHKELVQHGAGFLQHLDAKTSATHIIASFMPPKKAVEFARYRVVKPAWVTDSIQAGRLLPWSDYRLLNEGPRQKTLKLDGEKLLSQATQSSPYGRSYREESSSSLYASKLRDSKGRGGVIRSAESGSPFGPTPAYRPRAAPTIVDNIDDIDDGLAEQASPLVSRQLSTPAADHSPSILPGRRVSHALPRRATSPAPVVSMGPPNIGLAMHAEAGPAAKAPAVSTTEGLSSEEHNAKLRADPHTRKSTTANPDFLKQYYSESRLHHLSTWKAELKSRLQKMAAEKGATSKQGAATKRRPDSRRYIMHVDFDSFFCAVSLKRAPEYADKPAVVAHGTGSGSEIASCNYPARTFGVKNGMWMKRALELCPDLKVLPYDFPAYEEASRLFYEAILGVGSGGVVQSVSIDEALVDVTEIVLAAVGSTGVGVSEGSIWREQEKVNAMAASVREKVKETTGCNVSVGIGGNILLAKVALRKAKPAGQYQIRPEEALDILAELKVEDLPGVAYSIGGRLGEMGIKLVRDIRQATKERLASVLGPKTGEKLWEYARGIDRAGVGDQPVRKSVSADVNWGIRFINQDEADEFVRSLCKELERRLLNEGVRGKHLTMKIMRRALDAPLDPPKHLGHGRCDTFNKSVAFGVATSDADLIGKEAVAILRSYRLSPGDLRGLGVQLTKLEPLKSPSMGGGPESSQKKISFKSSAPAAASSVQQAKRQKIDPIEDDLIAGRSKRAPGSDDMEVDDPITEDPLTPRKLKIHPALAVARANAADALATTPLNITGTQFLLPHQPDPAVLAELPQDIRSRLMSQGQHRRRSTATTTTATTTTTSTTTTASSKLVKEASSASNSDSSSLRQTPALTDEIPADIDPEVFRALPDDMKAEILASYGLSPSRAKPVAPGQKRGGSGSQTLLPQSPRKDRIIGRPKERHTPTKRGGRGGGIRGMLSARDRQADADAHLLQTNLVAQPAPGAAAATAATAANDDDNDDNDDDDDDFFPLGAADELDPDFLAELPEDMRCEILEAHERHRDAAARQQQYRMQEEIVMGEDHSNTNTNTRPGLNFQVPEWAGSHHHRGGRGWGGGRRDWDDDEPDLLPDLPGGQTRLRFPAKPARVVFPGMAPSDGGGSSIADMRDMIGAWHAETRLEGPHGDDVAVLRSHLARVVTEERDMHKAQQLVRWLGLVAEREEEGEEEEEKGRGDGDAKVGRDGERKEDGANGKGGKREGKGKRAWKRALKSVKEGVQEAARARGMGPMDLG